MADDPLKLLSLPYLAAQTVPADPLHYRPQADTFRDASHDALHAEIAALRAEVAELREKVTQSCRCVAQTVEPLVFHGDAGSTPAVRLHDDGKPLAGFKSEQFEIAKESAPSLSHKWTNAALLGIV